ncbi:GGDEF domain-containing protein [Gracilibacillus kekensis]|uniref:Diguanylate cyclase (GGDEF) domain-containing protein n=1 Tax=Gracilibacillus kekensis TaxID=1027249 RepID=A0A1M7MUB7_9BACI|nr:GGDEF domain-containing protein [Gracilibacillus kekensis]SHM94609.1 diguanylate cyclase (GGDEF) domain-containing protein [Gracilibacillus kekensis]
MKSSEVFSLHARNKLLISTCWILLTVGSLVAIPGLGVKIGLELFIGGVVCYFIPTFLIWRRIFTNGLQYLLVFIFAIQPYFFEHYITGYMFSFFYVVVLSLYFNYKPVLLMGIANLIYTYYYVNKYGTEVFQTDNTIYYLIPLLALHALLTGIIIAQSLLGERMRSQSVLLEKEAKIDSLTGIYNVKVFREYIANVQAIQQLNNKAFFQIAIIDIDDFKTINDSYGHHVGDIILKRIAQTIKRQISLDDEVFRYGGEEFIVVLENKTLEETFQLIETIRIKLKDEYHHEIKADNPVTISIGLAEGRKGLSSQQLFVEADKLLYQAKANGKNQTFISA